MRSCTSSDSEDWYIPYPQSRDCQRSRQTKTNWGDLFSLKASQRAKDHKTWSILWEQDLLIIHHRNTRIHKSMQLICSMLGTAQILKKIEKINRCFLISKTDKTGVEWELKKLRWMYIQRMLFSYIYIRLLLCSIIVEWNNSKTLFCWYECSAGINCPLCEGISSGIDTLILWLGFVCIQMYMLFKTDVCLRLLSIKMWWDWCIPLNLYHVCTSSC